MNLNETFEYLVEDTDEAIRLSESFRPWESIKTAYAGKSDSLINDLGKEIQNAGSAEKAESLSKEIQRYIDSSQEKLDRLKRGEFNPSPGFFNSANSILGIVLHKANFKDGTIASFIGKLKGLKLKADAKVKELKRKK